MKIVLALALLFGAGQAQVHQPGNGVTLPKVIHEVKADYTNEARAQRIEGTVLLGAVVLEDGSVGDVEIVRSVDAVYGLDANAAKAMKQWTFKPGMKDGRPVAVAIHVEMTFSLK
jgi:protein TonB